MSVEHQEIDLGEMFAGRDTYVLRMRGDSMIEDHLCDGDYVVIERRHEAKDGEQAVVLTDDGQCTLKRVYFEPGMMLRLQPANKGMEPRIVPRERASIQGVVVGVMRSYR